MALIVTVVGVITLYPEASRITPYACAVARGVWGRVVRPRARGATLMGLGLGAWGVSAGSSSGIPSGSSGFRRGSGRGVSAGCRRGSGRGVSAGCRRGVGGGRRRGRRYPGGVPVGGHLLACPIASPWRARGGLPGVG